MPTPDSPRPPTSSLEPRSGDLHCDLQGDTIAMGLICDGQSSPFRTAAKSSVLDAIDALMLEADNYTECAKNWTENTSLPRRADDLRPLAQAGDALGELFFPGVSAARFIDKLEKSKTELVTVLTLFEGDLIFPWNLVRIPGDGRWLGEIACFRSVREGDGGLLEIAPDRNNMGILAAYADDDKLMSGRPSRTLPDATGAELEALERMVEHDVDLLDDLPPGKLNAIGLAKMQEWLGQPLHLFHFNCHASDPKDPQGFTQIGLRMGALASGRDVAEANPMTGGVVLDVCSAAQGKDRWRHNSFAACLHQRGLPALCAAICTVTDAFGTRFAAVLYHQVPLKGYSLFYAMRETQRQLVKERGDPMALYYTYEGSPRFEIRRY